MRRTIFGVALVGVACGSPPPPVIERATPVVHAPDAGVDAAPEVDAAVIARTPMEALPAIDFVEPLPDAPTPDELAARYALAVTYAATEPDRGLALLAELARHGGDLDRARADDAWALQWDQPVFRMIVLLAPVVEDGAIVAGKRHGLWREDDRQGTTWTAYVDGKAHGAVVRFAAERDAILVEGTYDHGDKVGTWVGHDLAGTLRARQSFVAGLPDGTSTYYDEAGAVVREVTITDGTGDYAEYSLTSFARVAEGRLEAGVKEGAWVERAEYGRWCEGRYLHGRRTGTRACYAKEGAELLVSGSYADDLRDGEWTYYFPIDGGPFGPSVQAVGKFDDDLPTGTWSIYGRGPGFTGQDHDIRLLQKVTFKRGKPVKADGKKVKKRDVAAFDLATFVRQPYAVAKITRKLWEPCPSC